MHSPLAALNAVLETGTADPILPLLAPGAVVWHNDDQLEVDAAALMARSAELHTMLRDVRVEVLRQGPVDGGWFQQFVLRGTAAASGKEVVSHRCAVVLVEAGQVVRIEEYVDPTFVAQLTAP